MSQNTSNLLTERSRIEVGTSDAELAVIQSIVATTMYTRPEEAAVREYVTNARDAVVAAGRDLAEHPVLVQVPSEENGWTLVVQDHGTGMDAATMERTYTTLSGSSKRQDATATGEMGIGSKAGFAVGDQITVTSTKDGLTAVLVLSTSETGLKDKQLIAAGQTDQPDGTRVEVVVRSDRHDERKWERAASSALDWVPADHLRCENYFELGSHRPHDPELGTVVDVRDSKPMLTSIDIHDQMHAQIYLGDGIWFAPYQQNHSWGRGSRVVMNQVHYQIPESWAKGYEKRYSLLHVLVPNKAMSVNPAREFIQDTEQNRALFDQITDDLEAKMTAVVDKHMREWFAALEQNLNAPAPFTINDSPYQRYTSVGTDLNPAKLAHPRDRTVLLKQGTRDASNLIVSRTEIDTLRPTDRLMPVAVLTDCAGIETAPLRRAVLERTKQDVSWALAGYGLNSLDDVGRGLINSRRGTYGTSPGRVAVLLSEGEAPGWTAHDPRVAQQDAQELLNWHKDFRARNKPVKKDLSATTLEVISRDRQNPLSELYAASWEINLGQFTDHLTGWAEKGQGQGQGQENDHPVRLDSLKLVALVSRTNAKRFSIGSRQHPQIHTNLLPPEVAPIMVTEFPGKVARHLEKLQLTGGPRILVLTGSAWVCQNALDEAEQEILTKDLGIENDEKLLAQFVELQTLARLEMVAQMMAQRTGQDLEPMPEGFTAATSLVDPLVNGRGVIIGEPIKDNQGLHPVLAALHADQTIREVLHHRSNCQNNTTTGWNSISQLMRAVNGQMYSSISDGQDRRIGGKVDADSPAGTVRTFEAEVQFIMSLREKVREMMLHEL